MNTPLNRIIDWLLGREPAPRPAPVLSCFIKGIIVSMTDHPEQWEYGSTNNYARYKHVTHDVLVSKYDDDVSCWYRVRLEGNVTELTDDESAAIRDMYEAVDRRHRVKRDSAKNRRIAALKAPFEAIGCPTEEKA